MKSASADFIQRPFGAVLTRSMKGGLEWWSNGKTGLMEWRSTGVMVKKG